MSLAPKTLLSPPPVLEARHGLIASAWPDLNADDGERWRGGFEFAPRRAGTIQGTSFDVCVTPAAGKMDPEETPDLVPTTPHLLKVGITCEAKIGEDVLRQKALAEFASVQSRLLEFYVATDAESTGALALNSLPSGGDLTGVGSAVSVERGIQLLSEALAGSGGGGLGMLHLTPAAGVKLNDFDLTSQNGRLQTRRGDVVVIGAGYPGATDGATTPPSATEHWIYATGPALYRLSDPWVDGDLDRHGVASDSRAAMYLDRGDNEMTVNAFRFGACWWDPAVHYGVLVDVTL